MPTEKIAECSSRTGCNERSARFAPSKYFNRDSLVPMFWPVPKLAWVADHFSLTDCLRSLPNFSGCTRYGALSLPGSADGAPRHRNQDSALHSLNQRYRLVNCISPSFDAPRLLPPQLPLLQICELPEMMHGIEIANLYKPCSNAFHHFPSCL